MTTIMYPEIDEDGAPNTEAVATYVGTDSEGDTISWDLRGADAALFTIDWRRTPVQWQRPTTRSPEDVDGDDAGTAGDDTATPGAEAGDNVRTT